MRTINNQQSTINSLCWHYDNCLDFFWQLVTKKLFTTLIIILIFFYESYSQSKDRDVFFKVVNSSVANSFSLENKTRFENLKKSDFYKQVYLIKLKKLSETLHQGHLWLDLPKGGKTIRLRTHDMKYFSENDFMWTGHFDKGTAIFMGKAGEIFGQFTYEDQVYDIQYLERGYAVMIHYDSDKIRDLKCEESEKDNPIPQKEEENTERQTSARPVNGGNVEVRILVLFTANALATGNNVNNVANLAVQQLNDALRNSAVTAPQLTFVLGGVEQLAFIETDDIGDDVDNLRNNPTARSRRDLTGSDIVVLLTNGNNYGGVLGIASRIGPDEDDAYAIVQINAATPFLTFAHEVGHLMGCRHQQCRIFNNDGCDDAGGDAHGFAYSFNNAFGIQNRHTMMHQLRAGFIRVPNFSNPDVFRDGRATGRLNENNNARVLRTNATVVCDFRFINTLLTVFINGPGSASDGDFLNFSTSIINGRAPYTYRWQADVGGGFYTTGVTTSTFSTTMPTDQDLRLRVTVTDATGAQDVEEIFVRNLFLDGGPCTVCPENDTTLGKIQNELFKPEVEKNEHLQVFPNFTDQEVHLHFHLAEPSQIFIRVLNTKGEVLQSQLDYFLQGEHKQTLDLSSLKSEVYIIQYISQNQTITKKIIKQ